MFFSFISQSGYLLFLFQDTARSDRTFNTTELTTGVNSGESDKILSQKRHFQPDILKTKSANASCHVGNKNTDHL